MAERGELLRSLKMSPHEQLFQDAVRRQQKLEELAGWVPEEATFQPQVRAGGGGGVSLPRLFWQQDLMDARLGGVGWKKVGGGERTG